MKRAVLSAALLAAAACSTDRASSPSNNGGGGGKPDASVESDSGGLPGADASEVANPDAGASAEDAAPPLATPDTGAPERCNAGTRWAAGMRAFREVPPEQAGLLGVQGSRLAVADIDGDGDPDLLVRRGGNNADDFRPGGVRQTWLLVNEGGVFRDVTIASGVRALRSGSSTITGRRGEVAAFADVDNDGDLDLYTGMFTAVAGVTPGETSELLLNDGRGNFTLAPADNALRRATDFDSTAGASFTDFDRDGNVDLWVGQADFVPASTPNRVRYVQAHLYKGDGRGGFTEVTHDVGLTTQDWTSIQAINEGRAHARSWGTAACDLDGDGSPELLNASYGRAPNHLFRAQRSEGGVRFENRSVASGYAYDDDMDWTENEFARCYCMSNRAAEGCADVPPPRISCTTPNWSHATDREPFRNGGNNGTAVCADLDNDGRMDLFTTTIKHWWAGRAADATGILFNSGEPELRFDRPGADVTGLDRHNPDSNWDNGDMTAAVFDFDNDGWNDIYIGASDYAGNHGLLFHHTEEPRRFEEVSILYGIDHHRSHGIVVADFDGDGDLDVIVGHSRSRCDATAPDDCYATTQIRYFQNQMGAASNWLQLDLAGAAGTNRAAIGARVSVTAGGVTQTQEVEGGHGHFGIQNDRVLHFGLGTSCSAEVSIRWPDARLTTERMRLGAGYRYRVVQGSPPVVERNGR